jgi:hypothetical protein
MNFSIPQHLNREDQVPVLTPHDVPLTKVLKPDHSHLRKIHRIQHIKVTIISHNTLCIRRDGTIHEFIVIRILLNEMKVEKRRYEYRRWIIDDSLNHISSHIGIYKD